jgi:hypothetical protein
MDNIVVTGGTPAQQSAIVAAHTSTIAALQTAQTQALSGSGPFATWFGTVGTALQGQIASAYGTAVVALNRWAITYNLVSDVYDLMLAPNIVVAFEPHPSAAVAAGLWSGYWDWAAIDPARAGTLLQLSVAHQAVGLSSNNVIYDQLSAIGPDAAKAFAAVNPGAAKTSLRNFLYYAFPTVTGGAGSSQSELRLAPSLRLSIASPRE